MYHHQHLYRAHVSLLPKGKTKKQNVELVSGISGVFNAQSPPRAELRAGERVPREQLNMSTHLRADAACVIVGQRKTHQERLRQPCAMRNKVHSVGSLDLRGLCSKELSEREKQCQRHTKQIEQSFVDVALEKPEFVALGVRNSRQSLRSSQRGCNESPVLSWI